MRIESLGADIGGTLVDVVTQPSMPLVGATAPPTTEPWVFVVDGSGTITAASEGIFGADELTAALDAL